MTTPSMPLSAKARQAIAERQKNPVLAVSTRGGFAESVHHGAVAISRASGEVIAAVGAIRVPVFPRSAYKLLQALPLVESGAAEAFRLSPARLALASASHAGEAEHVREVSAWLGAIGASESDLACGPHMPTHAPTAEAMIRAGERPSRMHNNCSGKHTGFLTVARHIGAPLTDYLETDHPVQRLVHAAIEDMGDFDLGDGATGLDGCGAPNFAMPLSALAVAYARVADPAALPPARREAILALRGAIREAPFFVAGTGRFCTRINAETEGLIAKVGAEGVYVAAAPRQGLGIALKIDDGSRAAAECVLSALLVGLGELAADGALAQDHLTEPLFNTQRRIAGHRLPVLEALVPFLPAMGLARLGDQVAKAVASH